MLQIDVFVYFYRHYVVRGPEKTPYEGKISFTHLLKKECPA